MNITNSFSESIRGADVNDIIAVGDVGFIGHFNGLRWQVYNNFTNEMLFLSVAIKGNTVAIVGETVFGGVVNQSAIIIGRR